MELVHSCWGWIRWGWQRRNQRWRRRRRWWWRLQRWRGWGGVRWRRFVGQRARRPSWWRGWQRARQRVATYHAVHTAGGAGNGCGGDQRRAGSRHPAIHLRRWVLPEQHSQRSVLRLRVWRVVADGLDVLGVPNPARGQPSFERCVLRGYMHVRGSARTLLWRKHEMGD